MQTMIGFGIKILLVEACNLLAALAFLLINIVATLELKKDPQIS